MIWQQKYVVCLVAMLNVGFGSDVRAAEPIQDPLADFFSLPIPDRYTNASEIADIHEVHVDIDGDGSEDVFVGHNKMWNGGNEIYFAVYAKIPGGYRRLLPANEDMAINFYGGSRDTIFVGFVAERGVQALMIVDPVTQHAPGDPGELLPVTRYSRRTIYYIRSGRLIVEQLGPLELESTEGAAFLKQYFGKGVQSRPISISIYSKDQLKARHYNLPDWKEPPGVQSVSANRSHMASSSAGEAATPDRMSSSREMPASLEPSSPLADRGRKSLRWIVGSLLLVVVLIAGYRFRTK